MHNTGHDRPFQVANMNKNVWLLGRPARGDDSAPPDPVADEGLVRASLVPSPGWPLL